MSKYEKNKLYERFMRLFTQLDVFDTAELIGVMSVMLEAEKYNKASKVTYLTVVKK